MANACHSALACAPEYPFHTIETRLPPALFAARARYAQPSDGAARRLGLIGPVLRHRA